MKNVFNEIDNYLFINSVGNIDWYYIVVAYIRLQSNLHVLVTISQVVSQEITNSFILVKITLANLLKANHKNNAIKI